MKILIQNGRVLDPASGLDRTCDVALAAGVVMGIMLIPFDSSLSDDILNAVPQALRDGSYGLSATQSETGPPGRDGRRGCRQA